MFRSGGSGTTCMHIIPDPCMIRPMETEKLAAEIPRRCHKERYSEEERDHRHKGRLRIRKHSPSLWNRREYIPANAEEGLPIHV